MIFEVILFLWSFSQCRPDKFMLTWEICKDQCVNNYWHNAPSDSGSWKSLLTHQFAFFVALLKPVGTNLETLLSFKNVNQSLLKLDISLATDGMGNTYDHHHLRSIYHLAAFQSRGKQFLMSISVCQLKIFNFITLI